MGTILVENLTKDYGNGRGVFDVTFEVNAGEVFGFLGPNGAGKTTTIRQILGFNKPQQGKVQVNGIDVWGNSHITNKDIGYIAGEIAFPNNFKGFELIKWLGSLSGTKELERANELIDILEIRHAVNTKIKRYSKGMKQKIAIISALMHDPSILIFDEPSSGLDPLMQEIFTNLVKAEKAKGKTILLSSHIFQEIEKTCDRVAIIKEGRVVTEFRMDELSDLRCEKCRGKSSLEEYFMQFYKKKKETEKGGNK